MTKFIPLEKRSKREQKEAHKANRVHIGFNTGSRAMKDRHLSRAEEKKNLRKMLDNEN